LKCLKKDKINVNDIIDFKKYTIVDNDRPKLCADRLDGVLLTGMFWTKDLNIKDVKEILNSIEVYKNENNEEELGFNNLEIAKKVMSVSDNIDVFCHSKEDNYMMELLANLTKFAIDHRYLGYEELYYYDEDFIHKVFESIKDENFIRRYNKFKNIKKENIIDLKMPYIKKRELKLLVNGKRI